MSQHTQRRQSLAVSTVANTAAFAAWTLFSILGLSLREQLDLSYTQFALLLIAPIFSGALMRLPAGLLAQRYGGRRIILAQLLLVAAVLFGYPLASTYAHYLLFGLFLGVAGATFAAGISYVSAWHDRAEQGRAMGVFGAGDIGAALTNLVAPVAVISFGAVWVPPVYGVVILAVALLFWLFSHDDPARHTASGDPSQPAVLRQLRLWRFGLYYFFIFGGFLALTLWLPQFYVEHYGLSVKAASFATLLFTVPAAVVRVLGGWFADTYGGRAINWAVFWVCLVCLFFLSYPPTTMTIHGIAGDLSLQIYTPMWLFIALMFVMAVAMGFGKASIFRLVYDYFPEQMGLAGGAVSMLGALGGCVLLLLFGLANDLIGVRTSCFMLLYGGLAGCMILMHYAIKRDDFRRAYAQAQADDFLSL